MSIALIAPMGPGPSEVGGAHCVGSRRKERVVRDFIPGEDFSIFNHTKLDPLEAVPEMPGDRDLGGMNEVVAIVWLK